MIRDVLVKIGNRLVRPGMTRRLLALSILVGLITGLASVAFNWLIRSVWVLSYGADDSRLEWPWRLSVLVVPAIGGLLVGPMVTYLAPEAKGHGVPEVMLAIARRAGRIRPIVAVVKSIASSICIGTGGAAGKEGPIVQIGSAFGSLVGQLFRTSGGMTKMLVACGAAGGISATFGTPIAGVLFALEVILQEFAAAAFSMVVISSVAASVVSKLILGERFFFDVPAYAQESHWELLMYAAMGVVAALYGRLFIKILYGTEDLFDRMKLPEWIKPAIGGLCLGAVGLALPAVLGTSHAATEAALWGRTSALMLLALSFAKMVATSLTLGSGGSGGVFSPSLFIGAAMGGSMGFLFNAIFPGITASPGAYALVGMGAVFAAATRAPITAVIIVFEMTNDYQIILPMMISVVIATIVSSYISEETIYTLKLLRRGIRISGASADALSMTTASEAMSGKVQTIRSDTSMAGLLELLESTMHSGFPVVDEAGNLVGLITPAQIQHFLQARDELEDIALVADVMISPSPLAFCEETLAHCAEKMGLSDVDRLPVVGREDPGRIMGIITHADILAVYRKGATAVAGASVASGAASNVQGGGI